ncbi:UNVERIFIED_CONTAM: hypothetical protein K2H54_016248 [Gekko kuhli]
MCGAICESFLYSVPEEKKSGFLVANVLKDLKVDVRELSARRAHMISEDTKQYFQLDPHSGNVLLKDRIDRESLCGQKDPCILLSEIMLENPLQVHRMEVEIEDVNDNSPQFSKKEFLFEIPEQVPTNTKFPLETAQDSDKGENAVQNYTLSPNDHFRLDVQSHSDGTNYAELVLQKQLDREENAQLFLILSAIDGGNPKRTGTAQVIVKVLDNNDNFPQFDDSVYKLKLKENTPRETLVTRVKATDRDLGSNAEITYSFNQVSDAVLRSFMLNKQTGELTVAGSSDYEDERNYAINIKATDGGGLPAYCKVMVEVEDRNDNAPEVTLKSLTSPLPEDSPPDTVVALFRVTDRDSGDNGRTLCTTEANLPFILKTSVNNYYQLITQQPLDRERVSEYNITITATDWGSPKLTSTRIINVWITDVNDNAPVFEKSIYEVQLWENNIPGLLIGLVQAKDPDTEQNAKVAYSLLPGKVSDQPVSSYVSINSETGKLYAIQSLDYEQVRDFQVTVRAVDHGSPPLSSEVVVRVVVMDENDNAPFILYPLQNGTSPSNDLVPRGAEAGYLVTKVVAVDRDSGQNSWLSYELLKATEPGLFSVGVQNGEVKTTRPINKRDTFKQKLIIEVRDNGHPPQTTSVTLSVLLVDGFSDPYMKMVDIPKDEVVEEEDHTLTMYLVICLAAISSIFLVSVVVFIALRIQKRRKFVESSALNFPVGPNFPENYGDTDAGSLSRAYNYEVCLGGGSLNSEFRFLRPLFPVFSVEPAQSQQDPRISSNSQEVPNQSAEGQVTSEQTVKYGQLNPISKRLFWETRLEGVPVSVLACRERILSLRAICESFLYSVPEEKKSGSLVANVLKDLKLDVKELSARRAQLVSEGTEHYFQLDPHSGNVLLNGRIDREALCGQKDPCIVLSEIMLENPLQVHRIEVEIEDVNDNSPQFSKKEFLFEIPEQVPTNTRFPLERAQDSDKGENAVQNYTLSPNDHFRLDVQSHSDGTNYAELVLQKQLDREENTQLFLILSAIDGGNPKRTGTAQVIVKVLDNNDNFPQFDDSVYKVKLKENAHRGTLVNKVEATDRDFGSYGNITYSFSQVPENVLKAFNLNEHTGEITVSGTIDYEAERNYAIDIKATDGGGLSAYCKVIVEIEDRNDNAPEVTLKSLTSPLTEGSPTDTVVALFRITDQDSGDNGRTACTTGANLPFVLKASVNNYYQLVTQQPLDRERVSEYNITITATDWGSPRLTSTRIINVRISDVNDNAPVFEKSTYEMQLWENNIPGLLIGLVQAKDLDTEQNAKVAYSLLPGKVSNQPVSSYVSINSETGNLYAIRSLDYEQVRDFQVTVRAVDSGSSPLSSEVIVRVLIIDENDNAPFILYPLQNGTSASNDLVPRGAEAGYLVTKVVAVDRDSGQNSWLSYELLKATEPGLFSVGVQNGEVKIVRPINKRDTFKQKLIIGVRDNGHPPQSTSATLSILLVDGFSDPYMKMVDIPKDEVVEEEDRTLTMYLVICLAVISFIFLVSMLAFFAIKIHKRRKFIESSALNFPVGPNFPENCGDTDAGSLSRTYNYEVCLAGGSLSSEFRFLRPLFPVFSVEPAQSQGAQWISSGSQEVPSHGAEGQIMNQVRYT